MLTLVRDFSVQNIRTFTITSFTFLDICGQIQNNRHLSPNRGLDKSGYQVNILLIPP